ncbi:torsin-like protein isoform X1 [Teleopsis dalmanni]|uniref:torsin-like protein isoform X1 n=2 Tax=Teleopsis dalmanni TaxID=139649 RepID=UPI0018CFEE4D|nr:torsin-like protein isoform X1 [Teleopsis dalmanni]XP_037936679.1 torsin-like protein isoform X1 [Teleopsis dalmanni]
MHIIKLHSSKILRVATFLISIQNVICFIDPVSMGVGIINLFPSIYNGLVDNTYCRYSECCNQRGIPANIKELKTRLSNNLYGQHIVLQHLIPALQAHFSPENNSRKPLVLSFHGTPGTGKNFVADQIAEALYEKGVKSRFVHKYLGRADFPLEANSHIYKERINQEVRKAIADCPRSLFIFDEVDKMPEGVFESLTSLVDYHTLIDKQDSTKAIFIFLSNTAGVLISDRLGNVINSGTLRDDTRIGHFEQILEKAAYNLDGGMKKTSLIEAHVIDHYLPFLPLEKRHIVKCVETEFKKWGSKPKENVVDSIINDAVTYDRTHGLFATSGCKTLDKKVAVEVMHPIY